jgi:hypothetical protein
VVDESGNARFEQLSTILPARRMLEDEGLSPMVVYFTRHNISFGSVVAA